MYEEPIQQMEALKTIVNFMNFTKSLYGTKVKMRIHPARYPKPLMKIIYYQKSMAKRLLLTNNS
jgi:hypothetical protein